MTRKKGRDWSEWKEHITGMHRLDQGFEQRHLRHHEHQTRTSVSLRDLDLEEGQKKPSILIWVLVFIGMLLIRKVYFEYTKYDRIKASESRVSRPFSAK